MTPEVSVVMSVFNGAETLSRTLRSILDQKDCDFEFIVVDDGSTDETRAQLDEWASKDGRLRVMHQANCGLTQSLIRGCAAARGPLIARQDAGDVSLPGRLASQLQHFHDNPGTVMVGSGARFLGPRGELLYEAVSPGSTLHDGLKVSSSGKVKGPPHHGATMFRRSAYVRAGGYRKEFFVAQDIDLWLRLSELGQCSGVGDVQYEATVECSGISNLRRRQQLALVEIATRCARLRRSGRGDAEVLVAIPPAPKVAQSPARLYSQFYYFVGSCLRQTDPVSAKRYFKQAIDANPFHFRARWRGLFG